jgi:hypothetical protein
MDPTLPDWWHTTGRIYFRALPIGLLAIWCLWAVNWRRAWPILAAGGWLPLVLIGLMAAAVWSLIWPAPANIFGLFLIPNGLWQFEAVGLLIGLVLFCGWLQSRSAFVPPEINLDEPAHEHGDHAHEPAAH